MAPCSMARKGGAMFAARWTVTASSLGVGPSMVQRRRETGSLCATEAKCSVADVGVRRSGYRLIIARPDATRRTTGRLAPAVGMTVRESTACLFRVWFRGAIPRC